ncbi:hypothetical protein [Streptomyces daliensis]|uniref:Excreted virulence factor EspC, type VII ESX diderm n=1 Tax=Streptomyces daliensis TaxID=299421 RepID=A0A8T4IP30_9ACTN|nr:hypothetical protein [Streptomyces daliensis]
MAEHGAGVPERWQRLLEGAGGGSDDGAGGGGDGAGTRLAGVDGPVGSGPGGNGPGRDGSTGVLKSGKGPWDVAATSLESLHGNVGRALGELRDAQAGAGVGDKGVDGLESVGAHQRVFQSWEARLEVARGECEELKDKLAKAGSDFYKTDQAVKDAFAAQETKPIPPPGGPSGSW